MPVFFTRAEAEAMLPRITPLLREIQRLRQDQSAHDGAVAADRAKVVGNGHMPLEHLRQHQLDSAAAKRQIARLVGALGELGILIKDLDTGLVDFPMMRDGREVYLCWRLDEPHIAWWHEVDTGIGGRLPLDDES